MVDWVKIDYNDPYTWPTQEQHVECLRWFPFDDERGLWSQVWGRVHIHIGSGFSVAPLDRPGLTSAGAFDRQDDWPETPTEATDWWRPCPT